MNELTNYQNWQLEAKGNILPEPVIYPSGQMEGGEDDARRFAEWIELQSQITQREQEF